ncbi:uncharacterized protein LOC144173089 [Haemaphysalis longicornis]
MSAPAPDKGSQSSDKKDKAPDDQAGTEKSGSGSEDRSTSKTHSKSKDHSGGSDKSEEQSHEKTGSKIEKSGEKSREKSQEMSGSKIDKSGDKSGEKSGDKSGDKTGDKSGDKTGDKSGSQSGSKTGSKSGSKSPEKSGEKTSGERTSGGEKSGDKTERSAEKTAEVVKEVEQKVEAAFQEGTQDVDAGVTPKEGSGSQREGSQQPQGDAGRMGEDKGLEGINALPEMHALRLMYENALLNVRNRQLQWLMSEVKQEHLVTLLYVGQLRKRRGTYTRPTAIMVDRAVSATLIGGDGVTQPTIETSGARYDDSRYANLPSVTVNIEDKGISAQDESLYAFGRGGPGVAKKCKHMTGPQDDLNWEDLQSHLLPAFYTF